MWEWRIFFSESEYECITIDDLFKKKLRKTKNEIRADYYYDLTNKSLGLKERGSSNDKTSLSKLELKILKKHEDWGAELWEKPIKHHISEDLNVNNGLNKNLIIQILEDHKAELSSYSGVLNSVITHLSNTDPRRLKILKNRRQFSSQYLLKTSENMKLNSYYTFERTEINFNDAVFFTFCCESENIKTLRKIYESHFKSIEVGKICGYPEFLI